MPSNAQDDIDAFLRLWGEPTPAELRLWTAALAPLGDQTADILAAWARQSERRPHPRELLVMRVDASAISQMNQIATEVAGSYGMSLEEIRSPDKHADITRPRQHVMFALREAGYSMTRIGKFLQRDHTTVMFGAKAHAARISVGAGN